MHDNNLLFKWWKAPKRDWIPFQRGMFLYHVDSSGKIIFDFSSCHAHKIVQATAIVYGLKYWPLWTLLRAHNGQSIADFVLNLSSLKIWNDIKTMNNIFVFLRTVCVLGLG